MLMKFVKHTPWLVPLVLFGAVMSVPLLRQPAEMPVGTSGEHNPANTGENQPKAKVPSASIALGRKDDQPKSAKGGEQAAKSPQNEDDGSVKWTDVWIVRLTAVLAALALAQFTAAGLQARWTRKAVGVAKEAADAAKASTEIANKSQRAFLFGKFACVPHIVADQLKEYVVWSQWENTGLTPATDVRSWIDVQTLPTIENRDPLFSIPTKGPAAVAGPRSTGKSGYKTIAIEKFIELWGRETEIYVLSRIEYRDILDPTTLHHHEQCVRLELIHEPSTPPPKDHPSYITFNVHGPQNTAG